jgi:hypothetical protein
MRILLVLLLMFFSIPTAQATSISWIPFSNSAYSRTKENQRGISLQYDNEYDIISFSGSVGRTKILSKNTVSIDPSNFPISLVVPMENGKDLKLVIPKAGTYTREMSGQDMTFNLDYRKKFFSGKWREGGLYEGFHLKYKEQPSRYTFALGLGWRYSRTSYSVKHSLKLLNGTIDDSFTNPFSYTKDNNCPIVSSSIETNWDFVALKAYANTDILNLERYYWAAMLGVTW